MNEVNAVERPVMPNLLHGDCLDLMDAIPDGSIDMVCCDMPYGTTNCRWDTTLDLQRLWAQYRRVLLDDYGFVGWWQAQPERNPMRPDQMDGGIKE